MDGNRNLHRTIHPTHFNSLKSFGEAPILSSLNSLGNSFRLAALKYEVRYIPQRCPSCPSLLVSCLAQRGTVAPGSCFSMSLTAVMPFALHPFSLNSQGLILLL